MAKSQFIIWSFQNRSTLWLFFERIFLTFFCSFSGHIWRDKEQIKIENEIQLFQRKFQQSITINLNNIKVHFPFLSDKCKLEEYISEVLSILL